MDDLIDDGPAAGGNAHEFTVSELSGAVKRVIEGEFGQVRVRAEVGRVTLARTGHMYFDLKDDRAVLSAVSWKGQVARMTVRPEEGMEVIATGRMTTFPGQSRYQLIVDSVEPAGAGALMAMLEARRKALAAEGLFAAERKRKLPFLPEVIGVVTSPTGAVIRDILHRLRDRFPRHVLIWPVAVQGQNCAAEVANAIAGFNALAPGGPIPRPDLIIVARGGGSVEDLWGFNEEIVVRAAAASEIPLVAAVGHETDTTLIDHAADRRAPTPTAAAELAVPVRLDLLGWTREQGARMARAAQRATGMRRQRLEDVARGLPRADQLMAVPRQRFDRAAERLPQALVRGTQTRRLRFSELSGHLRPALIAARIAQRRVALDARAARLSSRQLLSLIERRAERLTVLAERIARHARLDLDRKRAALAALSRQHETLGYRKTLERGYAVAWGEAGLVTSARDVAQIREIEFADGKVALGATARPRGKSRDEPPEQGSLF